MTERPTTELTVTQALSRIGTIQARLDAKKANVESYACRDSKLLDPIKDEGGSPAYVRRNMQAITDLETDLVAIRSAIQRANFDNRLTVCGQSRTVQEWLNWRREVLPHRRSFLRSLLNRVDDQRRHLNRGSDKPVDLAVNFPEESLREEFATLAHIEGTLDEELSVYNATVRVRIPE